MNDAILSRGLRSFFLVWVGCVLGCQAESAARAQPSESITTAVTGVPTAPTADDLERVMWAELNAWFPRCIDEANGGFIAGYDDDWFALPDQTKALVFQARMTWVAAEVARRRPDHRTAYARYARHGLDYLEGPFWDAEYGGFFWELDADGRPTLERSTQKHLYGQGFAIYAAANTHRLLGDAASLGLAQRAFRWVEAHARDHENGGYHEALDREGNPIPAQRGADGQWQTDVIGTAFGFRSMNTHIHLLEAYTALYRVWPDPDLRTAFESLLDIVAYRIYVEPGCLNLFFTADWQAIPDHDSFGHDVETTYLLLEAAELLGPEAVERVAARALSLTRHALAYGIDHERGGLYDAGSAFRDASDTTKVWWAQAEALNALNLMSVIDDDPEPYAQAFARTWAFVERYAIDPDTGGWWWSVDATGQRVGPTGKGNNWKSAYHTVRALLEVTDRMRGQNDGH